MKVVYFILSILCCVLSGAYAIMSVALIAKICYTLTCAIWAVMIGMQVGRLGGKK